MQEPLSLLEKVEGDRAKAALEIHNEFASDTQAITVECPEMAGYVVIAWDDEGHFQDAMCNGVRSPYAKEMIGMLLAKKVEHLFFSEGT